jgi:hypothetical protein
MMKIEPVLAEVGELLGILTIKLGSATVEEMPALIDEANEAARLVLKCCLASDPASHFSPEEAAMLRAELVRLGEALEAQIAGIIIFDWRNSPAAPRLGRGIETACRLNSLFVPFRPTSPDRAKVLPSVPTQRHGLDGRILDVQGHAQRPEHYLPTGILKS